MNLSRTDEELAAAVQEGDRQAAHELLARYERGLMGFSLRLMRNREDASEVAQEAMVKALAKINAYDPSRPFSPWIYRITRNLCIDRYRRKRPMSELNEETTATATEKTGSRFGRPPDAVAQQRQLNEALARAMDTLGDKYREIIQLYHYEHMTYREIAEQLGLPDGTVMNRLFRARKKLQAALLDMGVTP